MSFTSGTALKLTIFGSSHGELVGATLDGVPAGLKIDENYIRIWMKRRRPAQSFITTQRKEEDVVEIVSGVARGFTEGGTLTLLIRNKDAISSHYEELKNNPRPGHGDISLFYKYGEFRNYSGGGFLSGRMTAPLVAAGSIALSLLEKYGIKVVSYIDTIGPFKYTGDSPSTEEIPYSFITRFPDKELDQKAAELIGGMLKDGDSIGGAIKTVITGVPAGLGEPFFHSVESVLSASMFSIPGLKGVEFGDGFDFSEMRGSQANDEFAVEGGRIVTVTNHNGGILGGISNGMPLVLRVAMKPTSSIRKEQNTVNLEDMKASKISIKGRHDPCIAIRAVPVVQTMAAYALCDLMIQAQKIPRVLEKSD